jgi:hypothetical protein
MFIFGNWGSKVSLLYIIIALSSPPEANLPIEVEE